MEQRPLWLAKGEIRPGGISWLPWLFLTPFTSEIQDKVRVAVSAPKEVDRPGLFSVAVKCPPAGTFDAFSLELDDAVEPCADKLYLLTANANTQLNQTQVTYQIKVKNIVMGDGILPVHAIVRRAVINESSTEFRYESERIEAVVDGTLYYTLNSSVPATDFLEIEFVAAEQ